MGQGQLITDCLGNVAQINMGQSPDSEYYNTEGIGIPLIQGNADLKERKSIGRIWTTKITKRCDKGDLILTVRAPVGKIGVSSFQSCIGRGVCSIKPKNTDRNYLFYLLIFNESSWNIFEQGSTFSAVGSKEIINFPLTIINSPTEQTRIAEILSTADEAIAQTEALIAKYQRIKTGLMQDLLTKGIDENGNIRSKETHKFVVKNGIEVPEEWEVDTFSQFCSIIKDGTHLPPKRVTDGIWLLGVSNIIGGEWTLTNSDTQISEEFYNQMHKNWQIEIGDVLLAIVGATIGKVTQVPTNFPKFTLQRSVCLLRGKEKELSNDFLRLFIESLYFQRLLWNEVNVTAQPGIYLDTIGKFLIGKPRFEEQLMIVDKLSSIKETIDSLLTNLAKLQSLKTGLMQDLLSGRVRVNMDNKN